jgi:CDP-glucose 4,6-dehydratase
MLDFYKNKRVFITGHTGFKGTWLSKILINEGAIVTGYALEPPTTPNLFELSGIQNHMTSIIGDIRDKEYLQKAFNNSDPEIVIHLAAQPIVRESYRNPHYTYETNVMGTVNFLECVRESRSTKSVLNITTDKVYQNNEWEWGYREDERLNGQDPYSNSKACSELITHSYKASFLNDKNICISTARAGNVIGGGDFAKDRIIPDSIRAIESNEKIIVRNSHSIRPYQHVLEPLNAYLMIIERQYIESDFAGNYNVGPDECDCITTGRLVDMFCSKWGENANWINQPDGGPHEANFLKLDCSRIKKTFGWKQKWYIEDAIDKTIEWTKVYLSKGNISKIMDKQINEFFGGNVNV